VASNSVITVDVEALNALANRIDIANGSLVNDTGMFDKNNNGVEHPVLRGSLDKFEENWSDRRHEIHDGLDKTANAMRKVARTFAEVDEKLADALNNPAPASGSDGGSSGEYAIPVEPPTEIVP
jgi:uncharacterized protein YukE